MPRAIEGAAEEEAPPGQTVQAAQAVFPPALEGQAAAVLMAVLPVAQAQPVHSARVVMVRAAPEAALHQARPGRRAQAAAVLAPAR